MNSALRCNSHSHYLARCAPVVCQLDGHLGIRIRRHVLLLHLRKHSATTQPKGQARRGRERRGCRTHPVFAIGCVDERANLMSCNHLVEGNHRPLHLDMQFTTCEQLLGPCQQQPWRTDARTAASTWKGSCVGAASRAAQPAWPGTASSPRSMLPMPGRHHQGTVSGVVDVHTRGAACGGTYPRRT